MRQLLFILNICLNVVFYLPVVNAQEIKNYTLSMDDATRLALDNSYDIQLLKYDAWIARTKKGLAQSIYDTILEGEVGYRDDQRLKSSTIFGTKTVDNDYNASLSKQLPTGTNVSLDMINNRNATNSSFVTQSVNHDSSLGVSVAQSLGRNVFGIQDRAGIKITLEEIQQSEYTSLDRIENFIADVQKTYWDLAAQIQEQELQQQMTAEAKKLFESQQAKFADGLVEKSDLIAVEANYQQRVNDLRISENLVKRKANILRLMLNISADDAVILPSEKMSSVASVAEEVQVIKSALENRWDYKTLQADLRARNIRVSMRKNNLWPQIDLKASFKRNGLGEHFHNSLENVVDQDNPDLVTTLTIRFPLENSKASAEFKQAKLDKARGLIELKWLERKIVLELLNQRRDCLVFQEVAQSQEEIAKLQGQKFDEEMKRFSYGRSSIDQIIRYQQDVLAAQQKAVEAGQILMKATIDLERLQGKLLAKYLTSDLLKE